MTTLYDPTEWVSGTTPLSAGQLNKIEQGIRGAQPIGSLMWSFADSEPGYLKLDGSEVSRSAFQELFDYVVARNLINNGPFGNGDGATTFVLPDVRQRFPRVMPAAGTPGQFGGQDDHSHANPDTGNVPGHEHSNPTVNSNGNHAHGQGSTGSAGSHDHPNTSVPSSSIGMEPGGTNVASTSHIHSVPADGSHAHSNPNTSSAGSHGHSQGNTGSGGSHQHAQGDTASEDNRPAFFEINCFIAT